MTEQVIDRTTFDQLKAMMGADFIGELIDTYLEDSPQLITALNQALASNDYEAFRRAAHSLKSNSASFGATALAGQARELEMMGKNGSLEGATPLLAQFSAGYEQVSGLLMVWRHES